jgi:hypothetical protein
LTPQTSYGFDVIESARDMFARPFDPWQEWAVVHAGELLPDGRPRFRIVLILVSRQNGKTELLVMLALHWQYIEMIPMVLGTSTKLNYAYLSWNKSVKYVRKSKHPDIVRLREDSKVRGRWYREANGEQVSWVHEYADDGTLLGESEYRIAPANEEGGRSLTVGRLVMDELRQHHDYSAWGAAEPTTQAVRDAQIFGLSNMGDDRSVVLNDYRENALDFITWWDENGNEEWAELLLSGRAAAPFDHRIGLFEWSATPDADPTDLAALAQANPNLGYRLDAADLLAQARTAVQRGGDALATFKTESMCIRVPKLNPAIDSNRWKACLDVGDLSGARSRVVLCADVSLDEQHATLIAAAVLNDGRVRVDSVAAWDGPDCVDQLKRDLPGHVIKIKPQTLGWFPNGPAASLGSYLTPRPGRRPLLPPSVKVEPIKAELPAVCMGLGAEVNAGTVAHSDDPLINAHVLGAEKLPGPNGTWVFSRKGGHCDAAYGAAGAVHLARTLPAPVGKPRLITVPQSD